MDSYHRTRQRQLHRFRLEQPKTNTLWYSNSSLSRLCATRKIDDGYLSHPVPPFCDDDARRCFVLHGTHFHRLSPLDRSRLCSTTLLQPWIVGFRSSHWLRCLGHRYEYWLCKFLSHGHFEILSSMLGYATSNARAYSIIAPTETRRKQHHPY